MADPPELQWDASLAEAAGLVAQRNLPSVYLDDASAEDIEAALQKLTHVRLDREQLSDLHPSLFHILPNLTNLYLQQNELTSLKALKNAKELRFLTVAGNHITELEGLSSLLHLIFFDASDNFIQYINGDTDLPKSLSFLNVTNNPCCLCQEGFSQMLKSSLPNLKDLDWKKEPQLEEEKEEEKEEIDEATYSKELKHAFDPLTKKKYVQFKDDTDFDDDFLSDHIISKDWKKLEYQEAWRCATSNAENLALAIHESQARFSPRQIFNNCPDASEDIETKNVVEVDTMEEYKKFLKNYVDKASQS